MGAQLGRLTVKNGGFQPLVPPPAWSTIVVLLRKATSPRFTILNGGSAPRPGAGPTLWAAARSSSLRAAAACPRAAQPGSLRGDRAFCRPPWPDDSVAGSPPAGSVRGLALWWELPVVGTRPWLSGRYHPRPAPLRPGAAHHHAPRADGRRRALQGEKVGLGRIVASEIEVPNMLENLI